jgi:hypothetical protein
MKNQSRIDEIIKEIKALENELKQEYANRAKAFYYDLKKHRFTLSKEKMQAYRKDMTGSLKYLWHSKIGVILTVPVIWAVLLPALVLDIFVSIYQAICFPIYKIPKVKRDEYIILDRYKLFYLNNIEKLNCLYCEYFNGLIAYVREIAARTEQHWCPIKHAKQPPHIHSRYDKFFDYGDVESYKKALDRKRKDFKDIE